VSPKLRIKAKDIIADLRSGITEAALMTKYNISSEALQKALTQLLEDGYISQAEYDWRPTEYYDDVIIESMRELPRLKLDLDVPVLDTDDPVIQGLVRDITERGLKVEGIPCRVDETRRLAILTDQLARIDPVEFEANCRWVSKDSDDKYIAGFQITRISEKSLSDLRALIQAFKGRKEVGLSHK
jgi:hypothetical protein